MSGVGERPRSRLERRKASPEIGVVDVPVHARLRRRACLGPGAGGGRFPRMVSPEPAKAGFPWFEPRPRSLGPEGARFSAASVSPIATVSILSPPIDENRRSDDE